MPTSVTRTVRASGGDYSTLSSWEAGEQANLVSLDQIREAVCYNDWPGGLSDDVVIDGWTTDATRYPRITVAEGHRHRGYPKSGFYIKKASSGTSSVLANGTGGAYARVEWLDVENASTVSGRHGIRSFSATGVLVTNCLSKTNGTGSSYAFAVQAAGCRLRTCLAHGSAVGVFASVADFEARAVVAAGCATGFSLSSSPTLKNCIGFNNTTHVTGGDAANSSNNAFTGGVGFGVASVTGITSASFVSSASNDFHLVAGATSLRGAGANLFSEGVTIDIDGDARPSSGAWDIGLDQYVASAPSSLNVAASNITSSGARATVTLVF